MAKSSDRKARKAKARQEAIRKQKATTAAQPRIFRQHPGLAEALSTRHPLIGYFVNQDWAQMRLASIQVIRQAESGQVFAGFLVDLLWRGTKDVYGQYGLVDALAELHQRRGGRHPESALVPLDRDAAVNAIRGGIAWARRWRYPLPDDLDIWLRLVDPAPAWGLDLGIFGEAGERPIILGTPEEVARYEHINVRDLEPVAEAPAAEEAALPPGPAQGPGGLWLPGSGDAGFWRPDEEPPPEEEEPTGPGGLWLPGH